MHVCARVEGWRIGGEVRGAGEAGGRTMQELLVQFILKIKKLDPASPRSLPATAPKRANFSKWVSCSPPLLRRRCHLPPKTPRRVLPHPPPPVSRCLSPIFLRLLCRSRWLLRCLCQTLGEKEEPLRGEGAGGPGGARLGVGKVPAGSPSGERLVGEHPTPFA